MFYAPFLPSFPNIEPVGSRETADFLVVDTSHGNGFARLNAVGFGGCHELLEEFADADIAPFHLPLPGGGLDVALVVESVEEPLHGGVAHLPFADGGGELVEHGVEAFAIIIAERRGAELDLRGEGWGGWGRWG